VPDGWVTKPQTVLRPQAATAATAGVGLASTFLKKSASDVMSWTVFRRYAAKKEEPARAPTRTSPKSDEFSAHHHKNNTKQEVLQVALLRIYDVEQEPPALVSQQQFPFASDAIAIADELAKRKPERLYRVFDADMNVVYAR
jgi:hypothetical protein